MYALPRFIKFSAIALLLCGASLSLPAYAQDATKAAPKPQHHMHMHHHMDKGHMMDMKEHVEERIKTLHDAINVTAEQESDWSDVAKAMRDSEASIGDLVKARHENTQNTTAIEDIKSYQAISQAHADAMSKFIDAFEPFYNDLTPEQKQKADAFFKNFQHHDGMHHEGQYENGKHAHHKKAVKAAPAATEKK